MKVSLVCTKVYDSPSCGVVNTLGNEYEFHFDSSMVDCDGYIVDDIGHQWFMELPSNSHRYPDEPWKASNYFVEVVEDPQN